MSTQPDWTVDDLMAIADAAGVTAPTSRPAPQPTSARSGQVLLHPSMRDLLADTATHEVVTEWAALEAGAPIPFTLTDLSADFSAGPSVEPAGDA